MNLKEQTLEQLKALAYDLLAQRDQINQNLQIVNNEIAIKSQEEVKKEKK